MRCAKKENEFSQKAVETVLHLWSAMRQRRRKKKFSQQAVETVLHLWSAMRQRRKQKFFAAGGLNSLASSVCGAPKKKKSILSFKNNFISKRKKTAFSRHDHM
jgi:hypothetical protein